MSDLVQRLREQIVADAFATGGIRDGRLAGRLIRERGDAADELERLTRELEEARKDAERYRWLKETFGDCRHGLPNLEAAWDDDIDDFRSIKFWSIKTPEDVDAAIDAAMSQEKRKDALDRMARDADELGLDY